MKYKTFLLRYVKNPIQQFILGIFVVFVIIVLFITFSGTQIYIEKTVRDGLQMAVSGITREQQ